MKVTRVSYTLLTIFINWKRACTLTKELSFGGVTGPNINFKIQQ